MVLDVVTNIVLGPTISREKISDIIQILGIVEHVNRNVEAVRNVVG